MTQAPAAIFKIPAKSPQLTCGKPVRPAARAKAGRPAARQALISGLPQSAGASGAVSSRFSSGGCGGSRRRRRRRRYPGSWAMAR